MIVSSQGFGHFTTSINNQDFGIETSRMLLILDGCSGGKYSEVGTRLFAQLFSRKEECDNVEKFEDNVKSVFADLIEMMRRFYPEQSELEDSFVMENLLFTIIACFETEDAFIVKFFGDGYIIAENKQKLVSFMKFYYGKCPPYLAYNYCTLSCQDHSKSHGFKTLVFSKDVFSRVAIASDGVMPIAKGDIKGLDRAIMEGNTAAVVNGINSHKQLFYDDVTIAAFGGENQHE